MKVLVLGHGGMLGHSVVRYYKKHGDHVLTSPHRWPRKRFTDTIESFNGDLIINCVASNPQKSDDFKINYELPIFIANNIQEGVKYIHPETDGIFKGDLPKGRLYDKYLPGDATDRYGISKAVSKKLKSRNTKVIRSSLIGLDKHNRYLLSWFLNQKFVKGYTNHYWNGITVYHWAHISKKIFLEWSLHDYITQVASECISKADLLKVFNRVFDKKIKITELEHNTTINRCLQPDIKLPVIEIQLKEYLKDIKEGSI